MYESLLSIVGFSLNTGNIIKLPNITHTDTILMMATNFWACEVYSYNYMKRLWVTLATHILTYTNIDIHKHIHTCKHTHNTQLCTHKHKNIHVHMHIHNYTHVKTYYWTSAYKWLCDCLSWLLDMQCVISCYIYVHPQAV